MGQTQILGRVQMCACSLRVGRRCCGGVCRDSFKCSWTCLISAQVSPTSCCKSRINDCCSVSRSHLSTLPSLRSICPAVPRSVEGLTSHRCSCPSWRLPPDRALLQWMPVGSHIWYFLLSLERYRRVAVPCLGTWSWASPPSSIVSAASKRGHPAPLRSRPPLDRP